MTLHTESALRTAVQEVAIHRPVVGVMASQAIHRQVVPCIDGFVADGVGKRAVLFVAPHAQAVTVFQHGDAV